MAYTRYSYAVARKKLYITIFRLCRIVNFTPDLSYYETRRALYRAFSVWSDVTTLKFHEVQTGPADILIEFAAGYHHDGYPFDGEGLQSTACDLILAIIS